MYLSNEKIQRVKRKATAWEKTFTIHIPNKEIVSITVYIKYKKNHYERDDRQMDKDLGTSPEKIHKWTIKM